MFSLIGLSGYLAGNSIKKSYKDKNSGIDSAKYYGGTALKITGLCTMTMGDLVLAISAVAIGILGLTNVIHMPMIASAVLIAAGISSGFVISTPVIGNTVAELIRNLNDKKKSQN